MWRYGILGTVELREGERRLRLPGPKQASLLALLLVARNQAVSADRAIEALWPDEGAAGGRERLRVAVVRLRKALDSGGRRSDHPLRTVSGGYVLAVGADELDADVFDAQLTDGQRALEAAEPERAHALLAAALELWRGPALADVAYAEFAQAEIRRLEELRLVALEARVEADLELGRHRAVIADLEALSVAHPTRERLVGQLMLALYRSGRQADALDAYQRTRRHLADELGLEPGPALKLLQAEILDQQPALAGPPARHATGRARGADASTMPTAIVAAPANRTIGRASELREIAERLHAASVRLLTLTGPGGVGKTRLAFEAAAAVATDFADGAHIVSLAAARRPHEVPAAIVRSLGIILLSGESLEDAVERFLAAKHLLLVLDNCEQVPAAAPFIGRLPAVCPDVTVLATSREPLNVHAEHRYPVAPLALPEPGASEEPGTLAGIDSVALFCERARAHDPAFTLEDGNAVAVAEICRRVDGLPLAIELAAAGCALRSPGEIAERLHAALSTPGVGARDAPARQRTLAATIDWSYELLSDGERDCFARFAVFAGGATLDAAEAITGADLGTLDGLVAKSLLVRRRDAQAATRVGMLETVRVYAGERLVAAGDRTAAHERHYRHYLALAERHAGERALCGADGNDHLARLDADIENLHAALAWATDECEVQHALRLISALGSYWVMRSRYDDALRCIDQALQLSGADAHPALCFRALRTKALCLWPVGRGAEQLAVLAKAEALARRLGDPLILAQALHARAVCEITHERRAVADGLADEALHWARAAGDEWQIAEACRAKAIAASNISDLRRRVDAAASQLTAVGNLRRLASLFAASTYAALCLGSERDAMYLGERASAIASSLDDPYTTMITEGNRGLIALLTGALGEAAKAFCSELEACRDMVVRPLVSEGLSGLAAVAVADACDERAARLLGAAAAHRRDKDRDPVETRLEEEFFTPARTRLGAESWDTAAREGSALSFEDAIAYALAAPRAPVPVHRQATR